MSCPLPKPLKLTFWNGERTILKRDAMILRVTSDTGLRGYAPGPAHERAAHEIRDVIGPFLVGKDPLKWKVNSFHFSGSLPTRKGPMTSRISCAARSWAGPGAYPRSPESLVTRRIIASRLRIVRSPFQ